MEAKLDILHENDTEISRKFAEGFDVASRRPWLGRDGQAYITKVVGYDQKEGKNVPIHKNFQVNADTTTLRPDEWKELDRSILTVARGTMTGIQDLISRGLTYNLGDAMATTALEWETMSEAFEADISMDPERKTLGDRVEFGKESIPIPIVHADYVINERALRASRKIGNPLDTIHAEQAARAVADKLEKMLFQNFDYRARGGRIFSYINFPWRNQVPLGGNWNDPTYPGTSKLLDVMNMKEASIESHQYGPWTMYIPTDCDIWLDKDYNDNNSGMTVTRTVRQRLMDVQGLEAIKTSPFLPSGNIILVQMTANNVRLITGLPLTTIQWTTEGSFVHHYKVMTIMVPQFRADFIHQSGIVHGSV
jgi:hypothetical protein